MLRKETIAAFVYLVLAFFFMAVFQVWADETNTGGTKHDVLPDIGFKVLPYLENFIIVDIYVHLYFVITLVRIWFTPNRQTAYRRIMWVMGTLYFLRSFTISFTVLPTPYEGCELLRYDGSTSINAAEVVVPHQPSPFYLGWKVLTLQHSTCGDVLYSGHTMVLTTSAILWHIYTVSLLWKALSWVVAVVGMVLIVATHFHYSDDVILAFILTIFGFFIYHWGLWIGRLHRSGAKVPFGLFGDVILLADGTDQHRYCGDRCTHINDSMEVVPCDTERYSDHQHHLIVTPPHLSPWHLWQWISHKTSSSSSLPNHDISRKDMQVLLETAATFNPNISDHMQEHVIGARFESGSIIPPSLDLSIEQQQERCRQQQQQQQPPPPLPLLSRIPMIRPIGFQQGIYSHSDTQENV